jgi:hypothetical protein
MSSWGTLVKRETHRFGRQWAVICALAIVVAACGGSPSTPAAASDSSAPSGPDQGSPVPSDEPSPTIEKLQPFISADIWSTCQPAVLPHFATTVQGAACAMAGVDAVTFELYASSADLQAAFDSIVQGTKAKPSTDMATSCAKGNWSGTWNRAGKATIPGNGIECDIDVRGAWIVQIDPKVNVLFQVNLGSGDGAALYKWWSTNTTVLEPGG